MSSNSRFSKLIERPQKATYNFQKSSTNTAAEKWFKTRKETAQVVITKPVFEDCPLDLTIPSYEDFDYVEDDGR